MEPRLTIVDLPAVGEVTTVEVGSSLVQKAHIFEYDAYELLAPYEHSSMGYTFKADPGVYAATKVDSRWTYYVAVSDTVETCGFGLCTRSTGGFLVSHEDGEIRPFEHMNVTSKTDTNPVWRKATYADLDEPSFRRELIYNGRSGSTIRVLYREFSHDMARPAFSQDLTYDLSEGNIIGFQDVRIEVIDTSNVSITYKVLNTFSNQSAGY